MVLLKNIKESLIATGFLMLVCFSLFIFNIIPFSGEVVLAFCIGAFLLIIGQSLFLLGADTSLIEMGKKVGSSLTKFKNFLNILIFGFIFGFVSTIAEPDVSLFIKNLTGLAIPSFVMFFIIGLGVGCFVVLGLYRLVKDLQLKWILVIGYALILILNLFSPIFLGVAFDGGGVTTGTVTSPFLMAITIGLSAMKVKSSKQDSFGMLAVATMGTVLALTITGIFVGDNIVFSQVEETGSIIQILLDNLKNVVIILAPITVVFFILNIFVIKLNKYNVIKICLGLIIAYLGLVLFLTGVSYGFSPMASYIGNSLSHLSGISKYILPVIFGTVLGFVIVFTEPSVAIFAKQVETVSNGFLTKKRVFVWAGIGVAIAVLLSFLRIIFGFSNWFIISPIIILCCIFAFLIQPIFVGIAFDSGGVASGTMAVAFILPLASSIGDSLLDGYGVIGLISIAPILSLEILAFIYKIKSKKNRYINIKNEKLFYKLMTFRDISNKRAKSSAKIFDKEEKSEIKRLNIQSKEKVYKKAKSSAKILAKIKTDDDMKVVKTKHKTGVKKAKSSAKVFSKEGIKNEQN